MIADQTSQDPELSKIIENINSGTSQLEEFTLQGNILFKDTRVCIPRTLQENILKELHLTHPGIVKMKQLARRFCYWSNIDKDIERLVRSCESCVLNQKSPAKVPPHHWEKPKENFSRVHMDYAGPKDGYYYLILVDAKSKWPEIKVLKKAPDTGVTMILLEEIFSMHGYPDFLVSDNASIFKNEVFYMYTKERGITQIFSAPNHPATNGLAERYVQILKSKIDKMSADSAPVSEKVQTILQHFRATPLACGMSPSELYLNRQIRIRLDAIKPAKKLPSNVCHQGNVRTLQVGDRVTARVYRNNKLTWELGFVQKKWGALHYEIELDNGHVFKRHINQLRKADIPALPPAPPIISTPKKRVVFAPTPPINNSYDLQISIAPPNYSQSLRSDANQSPPSGPLVRQSARERRPPQWLGDFVSH
uniref:RNA-directed DNA polymerase n=1 Tax=Cacopsylla melanoneura TaxID=428564 RepID=A0A8D9B7U7_9HEMI